MRYLTKKKIAIIHAIVLFSIISTNVNAQQVVLTFTGRDSVNHYVQLNRVAITNLTKSWQETIIWPDTVLIMQNGTGIEDYIENGGFSLSQNNPNPFSRTTDVSLTTCEERLTQIEISDVNGHVVEKFDFSPQPGIHQFRVTLSAAGTYIMTARQNGQTSSIKMVCYGGGGTNVIDYLGMVQTITFVLKSTTTNPFNFGDMMEYVGYATINGNEVESQRISQAQGASQTFVLQFDVSQNQLPALTTHAVNNITTSSATVGGTVTADGGATVFDRGVCYSTTQMPTVSDNCVHIGQGTGLFSDNLTGLTANTTYYVRAYAMNSVGTAYGNEVLFTTTMAVQLPTVITTTVSNITETTAFSGGNVTFDGGATVTARGVCWSTSHNPTVNDSHTTDGNGMGSFTSNIAGLTASTTYYVRAYAINSAGTAYGDEVSFTTAQVPFSCGTSTLSDIDGNMYNTVQIGNQCWMKENLRTTHYSDNTAISHGVSLSSDVPYYYYPDSSYYNVSTYGLLYNWKAVMHSSSSSTINPSGVQGICPNGWHVPSEAEWVQLTDYVSSQSQYACGSNSSNIAKALANNTGWESSTTTCAVGNTQSNNNATGFSAMPAGGYFANGTQASVGVRAYFWSTTENTNTRSYRLRISSMYSNVSHGDNEKTGGLSVRCLKNNDGSTIQLPTVTTTVVSNITGTTAIGGGNVTSDGGVTVTTRGVCWSTSHNPTVNDSHTTDGSGMGSFTSNITGLISSTTYYVRAYATNSVGTAYGDEVSFTTVTSSVGNDGQPCQGTPTLTDIDGNVYNTVQIGNQCWMKENLRTTRYANGASIPIGEQYSNSDPYYYNYSSSPIPLEQRGYLYNWFALMHGANSSGANPSGVQGVCPTGWHVPSSAEWSQLTDYVQSQSQYLCISSWNDTYITKALASQTGWNSSPYENCDAGYNPSTNNATGFSAVPAGGWGSDGFDGIGISANFWSSTEHAGEYWWTAYGRGLYYIDDPAFTNANLFYTFGKGGGNSVRCLRNDGGGGSQSLPSVSTCAVSDILANTATSGVNVISDGGTTVTECGVCWSTNHNPTTSQNHTTDGCGMGSFISIITGLSANTTYYVRAYATNSIGTAYGNEVSFTTTIQGAIIILEAHYVWSDGSGYQLLLDADATAYGTVIPTTGPLTSSGNADAATYATFEYKIPQNADGSTYTTNVVVDGSDTIVIPAGVYDFCITNPTPGDRIWIAGSEYGRQDNFTFQINQTYHFYVDMGFGGDVVTMQPSVTTNAVSNVTSTTATFGGTVTSEGGSEVGIRGVCWSTSHNPTLSNSHTTINDYGIGSFSSNITGLTAGTTYYVRAYATNSVGTAYGNEVSFTTINNTTQLPTVTTSSVSNVTETSATCGGNVTSNGGANVTARGVCWSTSHNPTTSNSHTISGSGAGNFTSNITGLTAGTTYYVRAYATNNVGTAYGEEVNFTTTPSSSSQDGQPCPGAATVTDIDGNTYNTVQIGQQCWMKENLKTTKYADGTSISQGSSMSATVPYWYYPNGASSNMPTYGLLYNWKAVMRNATSSSANPSGVQGICPTGWHVPSNAEMVQLTNYASSQSQYVCGNDSTQIAKALASTTGWNSNTNTCSVGNVQTDNNASGLSLTPAGCYWGVFGYLGSQSLLWTTTENSEDSENKADFWKASHNKAIINHSNDTKPHGYSVRCLRDESGSSTTQLPTVTTSSVSNVAATSATGGGNITSDGGANVTARGVCWSTSHNPTTSNSHTINGSGTGNFTSNITGLTAGTTYYVRAYATNNVGTAYGNEVSFTTQTSPTQFTCGTSTLTDIDGNVYNTVEIGNQCWMKENLRTTKYADGTAILQGCETWNSDQIMARWRYPVQTSQYNNILGLHYNWYAVIRHPHHNGSNANPSGVQGICPNGWHVPSDAEWTQLTNYVSSQSQYVCGNNNTYIAKALAAQIGWLSSSYDCAVGNNPYNNNATGFSAVPTDHPYADYYYPNVDFYGDAAFWSASKSGCAYFLNLNHTSATVQPSYSIVDGDNTNLTDFHSVRCLRDAGTNASVNLPTVSTSFINVTNATAICGGSVTDDGGATVTAKGFCISTTPDPTIDNSHSNNGSGTGDFIVIFPNTSGYYYVRAYAQNSAGTVYGNQVSFKIDTFNACPIAATITDYDGNVYNTVQIGNQCWMKENLRTTHYANGIGIQFGTNVMTDTDIFYMPSSSPICGYYYNWQTVMNSQTSSSGNSGNVQGICPNGWHVPSDADWTQLSNYVSSQSEYICGGNSNHIARTLASSYYWNYSSTSCAVGRNTSTNNATGFGAFPAGYYTTGSVGYKKYGEQALFWSNHSNEPWHFGLEYNDAQVFHGSNGIEHCQSVRCIKD